MSWLGRLRQSFSNSVVGVGQGVTPHQIIDSPKAFQIVLSIALVTIAGSAWLIGYNIRHATRAPQPTNTNTTAVAELNALKTKDTDHDGLSDYDELITTHTSPYLKDSDGDGTDDKAELNGGTDPNCPFGKICSSFSLLTSPTDVNGNLTPAFLREALHSAGVPQAQLDQTDDATLLQIYQRIAGGQPTNANQNSNDTGQTGNLNYTTPVNTNSSTSLSQLNNLSSAQIRQLLIQNGVDATTLQNVSDTTLQQIFQQAVQSSQ